MKTAICWVLRLQLSFSVIFQPAILLAQGLPDGNILKGKIEVYTKDGKAKEDNSNVVVFLDSVESKEPFLPPAVNPVMHQTGKKFSPEVLPVLAGTTVDFPNDDNVFHNVFSLSKPKPFDLGIYKQKTTKQVTFDEPGLVKVYCNIHPNMTAYILVLSSPYFALTDKEGNFVISGIPDENYTVRAWQRFGPEAEEDISFYESKEMSINLRLTEEKVSIKHKNKWGRDYPSKY